MEFLLNAICLVAFSYVSINDSHFRDVFVKFYKIYASEQIH